MSDAHIPPADEPGRHSDDLQVEVSDLRGNTQSISSTEGGAATPWYRQRVQVPRPLVVAALVVMLGLILLVATPIGSALRAFGPQPTPTGAIAQAAYPTEAPAMAKPSPYPTPTLIAPEIGPVPANCPPSTRLLDFSSGQTLPGVGGSSVWLDGFIGANGTAESGQPATAKLGTLQPDNYTQLGWPVHVQVLIKTDFTQTITLTGHDVGTNYTLWFSPDNNAPYAVGEAAPLATIDGSDFGHLGGTQAGRWNIWFGVLYLPGAGCYTLDAIWPNGGWVVSFAAGR